VRPRVIRHSKNLTWEDASFADIPDGRALDHVPHSEALDGLVFGDTARAIRATNKGDVATALLVAAAISSFLGLSSRVESKVPAMEAYLRALMLIHPVFEDKRTTTQRHKASEVPQTIGSDSPCCKVPGSLEVVERCCRQYPYASIRRRKVPRTLSRFSMTCPRLD